MLRAAVFFIPATVLPGLNGRPPAATLHNPGYPPDPGVRWARAFPIFPPSPEGNAVLWRARSGPYQTSKWRRNDPFALLDILEKDQALASGNRPRRLIPRASTEEISQVLRSAAAEDEDEVVRWAARYALRLTWPSRNIRGMIKSSAAAAGQQQCPLTPQIYLNQRWS